MVTLRRGEIWWADLGDAAGSAPGFRRPILIVQDDAFNRSRIATTIGVALTSNTALAAAPGNVLLPRRATGLPRDSVANVSQLVTIDREQLTGLAGRLPERELASVSAGLKLVLGL